MVTMQTTGAVTRDGGTSDSLKCYLGRLFFNNEK